MLYPSVEYGHDWVGRWFSTLISSVCKLDETMVMMMMMMMMVMLMVWVVWVVLLLWWWRWWLVVAKVNQQALEFHHRATSSFLH